MNTNVEALQRLYVKMGGNPEDVSDKTTISEMIDAITTIGIVDKVARSGNYITATTAAEMDNEDAIYVYTGSETGYNQGHLYYWDGTAFVDGGEYNGARAEIDPTLSHTGKAADAKKTGDALASLNGSLENLQIKKEAIGNNELFVLQGESVSHVSVEGQATSLTVRNTQIFEPILSTSGFGVSVTKNDDGSYTLNGTATSSAWFHLNKSTRSGVNNPFPLDGEYSFFFEKISGSIEKGSATSSTWLIMGIKDGTATITALGATIDEAYPSVEKVVDTRNIDVENCVIAIRITTGIKYTNYTFKLSVNKGKPLPWAQYKAPTIITDLTSDIASIANAYMPHLWMYTDAISVISAQQVFNTEDYIDENLDAVNERIDTVADDITANVISANHRGYHNGYPENTLWAFAQSKLRGFDVVETDVRFTSDGVGVLLHDSTINRTARNPDGTEIADEINIFDITYEQALQYDFGIYAGSAFAGTKIVTVEELIKFCKNVGLKILLETKAVGTGAYCANLVKKYAMEDNVIWTSFTASILQEIVPIFPNGKFCLLSTEEPSSTLVNNAMSLKNNTNFVSLSLNYIYPITSIIDSMVSSGIGYTVFTLDSMVDLATLSSYCWLVTSNTLLTNKVMARSALDEWTL